MAIESIGRTFKIDEAAALRLLEAKQNKAKRKEPDWYSQNFGVSRRASISETVVVLPK